MTPTYTLDHVRAALGDDAADKVRDYVAPPLVSPELRLARECALIIHEREGGSKETSYRITQGEVDTVDVWGVASALLALQRRHELDTPAQPQADADGWIAWSGGECPVPLDSMPGVKFPTGAEFSPGQCVAQGWIDGPTDWWKHEGSYDDNIIAYKPEPGK